MSRKINQSIKSLSCSNRRSLKCCYWVFIWITSTKKCWKARTRKKSVLLYFVGFQLDTNLFSNSLKQFLNHCLAQKHKNSTFFLFTKLLILLKEPLQDYPKEICLLRRSAKYSATENPKEVAFHWIKMFLSVLQMVELFRMRV